MQPDPDTWIAGLGSLPLLAQPGERWMYNTGASVLGVLIARATGRAVRRRAAHAAVRAARDARHGVLDVARPTASRPPTARGRTGSSCGTSRTGVEPPAGVRRRRRRARLDRRRPTGVLADAARRRRAGAVRRGSVRAMTRRPAQRRAEGVRRPRPGVLRAQVVGLLPGRVRRGAFGWDGGFGTSWLVDPAQRSDRDRADAADVREPGAAAGAPRHPGRRIAAS